MNNEVKVEEVEPKTNPVNVKKKETKRAFKWGCGCLTVLIVVSIICGIVESCNMTPEERKERKQQVSKPVSAPPKEKAKPVISYWKQDSVMTLPLLTATRHYDVDIYQDVIRITAGRDSDYGVSFQLLGKKLKNGFSYTLKDPEQYPDGCNFYFSDGKKYWGIFDKSDTYLDFKVVSVDLNTKTASFRLVGKVRNAVANPNPELDPTPGNETINFDINTIVSGNDFDTIWFETVDYLKLKRGYLYRLSADTVLAPAVNPRDAAAAMKQMKKISGGAIIYVYRTVMQNNTPWYAVDVYDSSGEFKVASGYVNSTGLVAQTLRIVPKKQK